MDISADGRYVVYVSYMDGIDPLDQNRRPDVYVYDRKVLKLQSYSGCRLY